MEINIGCWALIYSDRSSSSGEEGKIILCASRSNLGRMGHFLVGLNFIGPLHLFVHPTSDFLLSVFKAFFRCLYLKTKRAVLDKERLKNKLIGAFIA